jgi:hypothetical protein
MTSARRSLAALLAATALAAALPLGTLARTTHASARASAPATHSLPSGAGSTRVFSLGVQGGSLRPWSVKLNLDGSIAPTGPVTVHQTLVDPKNTLKGLLALADAEDYFALKKTVGCLSGAGNPDVSSRFISIHTATVTKRVQEFGSCAATAKFDQLYAVLEAAAGMGS